MTYSTTWMNLENSMLSGRSSSQTTFCAIPRIGNVQNRKTYRDRMGVTGFQGIGRWKNGK